MLCYAALEHLILISSTNWDIFYQESITRLDPSKEQEEMLKLNAWRPQGRDLVKNPNRNMSTRQRIQYQYSSKDKVSNQSINQSTNQSINQPTNQSINVSNNQSIIYSLTHSLTQSIN